MNKVLAKSVKRALKVLPSVDILCAYAIIGKNKRQWYTRARKRIKAAYGKDARIFAALLAATSPRQSVALNFVMARSIYNAWLLHDRSIDDDVLHELANLADLGARYHNVKRALKGEALSGPKVQAFYANLTGDYNKVTIDTWMITFAGLQFESILLCKGGILAYKRRVSKAAKRLSWRPAQAQAAIWSAIYAKVNKVTIASVPEFEITPKFDNADVIC